MKLVVVRLLVFLSLVFIVTSCQDKEAEKLRTKVNEKLELTSDDNVKLTSVTAEQYKDVELQYNQDYVSTLQDILDNSFEKQLEQFEDKELGLLSYFSNMFKYIIKNNQEWEDMWSVKSNKYFNSLEVEQEINTLNQKYLTDIKNIRSRFKQNANLPTLNKIELQNVETSLYDMGKYSRNNIIIEVGTTIFEWLLGIFIVWLIIGLIGICIHDLGWVMDLIVTVIVIILSIILTSRNDNKLLNSIREQHQEKYNVDIHSIHENLDQNTIHFYEVH